MYNYYSASIVSARLSEPLDMMEDSVTVLADSNLKIAAEAVPYLNYFLYVRIFLDTLKSYGDIRFSRSACMHTLDLSETQLGIGLLQEETLGSTAGIEAILADRGGYEAGQSRYPGLPHGSQHGVSLYRKDVRSKQDLRIDGDSSVQAICHGYVRQSQRSIHRDGENRVSYYFFFAMKTRNRK